MLVVGCLCFLRVLCTAKTCDLDESEPVCNDCLNKVDGLFICLIDKCAVDLSSDGVSLPSNALFFFSQRMIFEHIFEGLVKLAGALNWRSQNNMLMALTYPWIVAD